MNRNKKLMELFVYIVIVVVGIILLFTSNAQGKISRNSQAGGAYHAIILDEQYQNRFD